MLNWIVWNRTVLNLTELLWYLTVSKQNYTYSKLNCLTFISVLNDPINQRKWTDWS